MVSAIISGKDALLLAVVLLAPVGRVATCKGHLRHASNVGGDVPPKRGDMRFVRDPTDLKLTKGVMERLAEGVMPSWQISLCRVYGWKCFSR